MLQLRSGRGEPVKIQDRIEYQGITGNGFSAVDGVDGEEQDIAAAQMRVDHDGLFGNRRASGQQPGEQQVLFCREAKNDVRAILPGYQIRIVARFLLVQRSRFPGGGDGSGSGFAAGLPCGRS